MNLRIVIITISGSFLKKKIIYSFLRTTNGEKALGQLSERNFLLLMIYLRCNAWCGMVIGLLAPSMLLLTMAPAQNKTPRFL